MVEYRFITTVCFDGDHEECRDLACECDCHDGWIVEESYECP